MIDEFLMVDGRSSVAVPDTKSRYIVLSIEVVKRI